MKKHLWKIYRHPEKPRLILMKWEIIRETKARYFAQRRDIPSKKAEAFTYKIRKAMVEPQFLCEDGYYFTIADTCAALKKSQRHIIDMAEREIRDAKETLGWLEVLQNKAEGL